MYAKKNCLNYSIFFPQYFLIVYLSRETFSWLKYSCFIVQECRSVTAFHGTHPREILWRKTQWLSSWQALSQHKAILEITWEWPTLCLLTFSQGEAPFRLPGLQVHSLPSSLTSLSSILGITLPYSGCLLSLSENYFVLSQVPQSNSHLIPTCS